MLYAVREASCTFFLLFFLRGHNLVLQSQRASSQWSLLRVAPVEWRDRNRVGYGTIQAHQLEGG